MHVSLHTRDFTSVNTDGQNGHHWVKLRTQEGDVTIHCADFTEAQMIAAVLELAALRNRDD